jgi:ribose 5-phosphate isomerase RpiB
VLDDVLDDYVSVEAARRDYGVVITGTGADLSIDAAATRSLRASLAADPGDRDADAQLTADWSRVAPVSGHPRNEPTSRPPRP